MWNTIIREQKHLAQTQRPDPDPDPDPNLDPDPNYDPDTDTEPSPDRDTLNLTLAHIRDIGYLLCLVMLTTKTCHRT